jgi:quinol monooxygenase YgiN
MNGVIVTVYVKDGMEKEFLAAVEEQAKHVRTEPGFLFADLYRTKTPGTWIFVELYEDRESLDAHLDYPHSIEFGKQKKAFEAKRMEVTYITPVFSDGPLARKHGLSI